jgi:proline racemase
MRRRRQAALTTCTVDATFADKAFKRCWNVCRSWRSQIVRTPAGETASARFSQLVGDADLAVGGCYNANATTACSMRGSARFLRFGLLRESSARAVSPPFSYSSLNR